MEAAIANLLQPGEKIIVGNAGIWGERVADLSARYGGESVTGLMAGANGMMLRWVYGCHVIDYGGRQ